MFILNYCKTKKLLINLSTSTVHVLSDGQRFCLYLYKYSTMKRQRARGEGDLECSWSLCPNPLRLSGFLCTRFSILPRSWVFAWDCLESRRSQTRSPQHAASSIYVPGLLSSPIYRLTLPLTLLLQVVAQKRSVVDTVN